MKNLILASALASALIGMGHANAHDYNGDLFCAVKDAQGRTTGWTFDNNTWNKDGTLGTMVETGVYKPNGQTVSSAPGARPVWIIFFNRQNGLTLTWRQDPTWSIGTDAFNGAAFNSASAHLLHNGVIVANGSCGRAKAPTAANVGDQGQD
jgi:hypothetical protein